MPASGIFIQATETDPDVIARGVWSRRPTSDCCPDWRS